MEVNGHWFDWIFFAIVGIPWVVGLIQVLKPDWLEPLISGGHSRSRSGDIRKQ